MTWYIVYTCISYSIYTHSPVGKQSTFVVAPWWAIRPRFSFYQCFVGRNRRVCVSLASQVFFSCFFLSRIGLVLFVLVFGLWWLCVTDLLRLWRWGGVRWANNVQNAFGIFNTLLMLRCQLFLGTSNMLLMLRGHWNFQHSLDATPSTFSWNFQHALDATPSTFMALRYRFKPDMQYWVHNPWAKKTCDDLEEILGWFGRFI